MTQQYLAGELSLRLALLQDLATEQALQLDDETRELFLVGNARRVFDLDRDAG